MQAIGTGIKRNGTMSGADCAIDRLSFPNDRGLVEELLDEVAHFHFGAGRIAFPKAADDSLPIEDERRGITKVQLKNPGQLAPAGGVLVGVGRQRDAF